MTVTKPENELDEQAFEWAEVHESGPLSEEQQREFDAWVGQSAKHRGAFVRASVASAHFNRLGALAGGRAVFTQPGQFERRRRMNKALALSAIGLLTGGAWLSRQWLAVPWRGVRYSTSVGQVWTGHLTDGSEMLLNTATEVSVGYSSPRREIHLLHGEALFVVAHDAARPFVVRVGEWVLRAVGTAFAVRHDMSTTVTVTEGSIDMWHTALGTVRERLVAGQEARVDSDGLEQVRHISEKEVTRRLAWRRGKVIFDGQSLHDAVAEMNRYSVRQIRCDAPDVCTRQVAGVFGIDHPGGFLATVQAMFDLELVLDGNVALLTPHKKPR